MFGDLNDLHQSTLGVGADALHAVLLKFVFIMVIELITMTMPLANQRHTIDFGYTAALAKLAIVGTKTHGAAHVGDGFLFFHHVDDVVRRVGHLARVGILVAQHISGKFDDHHLHAQTNPEGGKVVDACVFHSDDLAFDATLSETGADQDTSHLG